MKGAPNEWKTFLCTCEKYFWIFRKNKNRNFGTKKDLFLKGQMCDTIICYCIRLISVVGLANRNFSFSDITFIWYQIKDWSEVVWEIIRNDLYQSITLFRFSTHVPNHFEFFIQILNHNFICTHHTYWNRDFHTTSSTWPPWFIRI